MTIKYECPKWLYKLVVYRPHWSSLYDFSPSHFNILCQEDVEHCTHFASMRNHLDPILKSLRWERLQLKKTNNKSFRIFKKIYYFWLTLSQILSCHFAVKCKVPPKAVSGYHSYGEVLQFESQHKILSYRQMHHLIVENWPNVQSVQNYLVLTFVQTVLTALSNWITISIVTDVIWFKERLWSFWQKIEQIEIWVKMYKSSIRYTLRVSLLQPLLGLIWPLAFGR